MAETRKQLTELQFAKLVEAQRTLDELRTLIIQAQQRQDAITELILEIHGAVGKQVKLDPVSKELIIIDGL